MSCARKGRGGKRRGRVDWIGLDQRSLGQVWWVILHEGRKNEEWKERRKGRRKERKREGEWRRTEEGGGRRGGGEMGWDGMGEGVRWDGMGGDEMIQEKALW